MNLADATVAQAYPSPGPTGTSVRLDPPAFGAGPHGPVPAADPPGSAEAEAAALHVRAACLRLLQADDEITARDLLAIVLGCCMPVGRAVVLADSLVRRFGSLGGAVAAPPARLRKSLGGEEVALVLLKALHCVARRILREPLEDRPVIGSGQALIDYLSVTMRHDGKESARLLFLDRKNGLIRDEVHGRGTVDHTPLYTREIVQRVLELDAAAVILVHNHPSGDPTPSDVDIAATRELAAALGSIRVSLHDHVIVGRDREVSFRKAGLLPG